MAHSHGDQTNLYINLSPFSGWQKFISFNSSSKEAMGLSWTGLAIRWILTVRVFWEASGTRSAEDTNSSLAKAWASSCLFKLFRYRPAPCSAGTGNLAPITDGHNFGHNHKNRKQKWLGYLSNYLIFLVPLPRFERGACGLGIRRSILLSYRGLPWRRAPLTRFPVCVNKRTSFRKWLTKSSLPNSNNRF